MSQAEWWKLVPGSEAACFSASTTRFDGLAGLDYVVVGPVNPTASHPGAPALGWQRFEELVRDRPMPAYAIGGLTRADLATARRHGAHGVALLRAAFSG